MSSGGVHSDNLRLVCIQLPLYCQNKCINFKSCVEFSLGGALIFDPIWPWPNWLEFELPHWILGW